MDFSKSKSRDNSMYMITEGYNLLPKNDQFLEKLMKLDMFDPETKTLKRNHEINAGSGLLGSIRLSKIVKEINTATNDYLNKSSNEK